MTDIKLFGKDPYITFKEDTHQYFDPDGLEYKSFSRVIKNYVEPFDAQKISSIISKGDMSKKQALLDDWELKKNVAIDHGNNIHNSLEYYALGKMSLVTDHELMDLAKRLFSNFSHYYRLWPEVTLYSKAHKIAGQTDLVTKRQSFRGNTHVFDFYDYKTNLSQGIRYDSIGWNKEPIRHYNRYMLSPIDYLEDCNYNKYSLQLSSYAYMAEITYGITVGKLMIIFIWKNKNGKYHYKFLPVPYMKMEAMAIFNDMLNSKKLPQC